MKLFVAVVALFAVALAEPKADAQYFYGNPYAGAAHLSPGLVAYPNGAVVPADTLSVQAAKAQHFAAKANAYANAYPFHYIGKREAEPTADADPQLLYSGLYGYPAVSTYATYHYTYPYRYLGKRSAEAEPKADPQYYGLGYGYAGYRGYGGYAGYGGYGYPYYGYGYYG